MDRSEAERRTGAIYNAFAVGLTASAWLWVLTLALAWCGA